MVQIDVPVAFGVSCFFADMARRQLKLGRAEYHFHTFSCMAIFQAFFFSWIPLYFLMNFFGWETTHMWWHAPSVTAYPYYVPLFVLLFWFAAVVGFVVGTRLVRKGYERVNRGIWIAILIYCGIWIFGQPGRSMRLGSYVEWKSGTAPWFYEDTTFLTMFIISMVVWIVGIVYFAVVLRRQGRHLEVVRAEPSEVEEGT